MRISMRCALPACLLALISPGGVVAEDLWSIRSHPFPGNWLEGGVVVEGKGRLFLPDTPSVDADQQAVRDFIQRSTAAIRAAVPELEEGSLAILDRPGHTLAARATASGHAVLEGLLRELQGQMSRVFSLQIHVVETSTGRMLELLEEAGDIPDHSAQLEALENLADGNGGEAVILASGSLETKSGQRALLEMNLAQLRATEMHMRKGGANLATNVAESNLGLRFEMDPVIGGDGRTLDLNLALSYPLAPPVKRQSRVGSLGGKPVEATVTDRATATVNTSTMLIIGQTRLIAAWPALEPGRAQAFFLSANAPVVRPKLKPLAQTWIEAEGETVLPAPAEIPAPTPDLTLTPGMMVKTFKVPPDFLSIRGRRENRMVADPFAAAPASGEAAFTVRMTAEEILKSEGIPFPEGASATFNPASGKLVVRNTPENIEMVQVFIGSDSHQQPKTVRFQLWVVEGQADRFRRLARNALAVTDHGDIWREVEAELEAGRASVVELGLIETKSGQRATVEAARAFTFTDSGGPVPSKGGAKEGTTVVVSSPGQSDFIAASLEEIKLANGLHWELDPVLASDNFTIDISTAIKANRQPFVSTASGPAGEDILLFDTPETIQPSQGIITALTTVSGIHRLAGSWQVMKADGTVNRDRLHLIFLRALSAPVE
jgi:hypothetical protein